MVLLKGVVIPIWISFRPNPRKVFLISLLLILGCAVMDSFSGEEFRCIRKNQIGVTKNHDNSCLRPNSQSKLSPLDDVVMFKNIRTEQQVLNNIYFFVLIVLSSFQEVSGAVLKIFLLQSIMRKLFNKSCVNNVLISSFKAR